MNDFTRPAIGSLLLAALAACAGGSGGASMAEPPAASDGPRIVQPGAPGQAARTFSAEELSEVEGVTYTDADVRFMQGMIPHHAQALVMTDLVRQYATTDAVRQMALRMEISQRDEIQLMETWLREHGEAVEMQGMDGMHGGHMMPGMLSPEQMETLGNARGVEFDRLFLEFMIQHHQGAITMVDELFNSSGAAQESSIFKFAEDVNADQTMEIERMQGILQTLR
jgi:uncharacterized protein (DUF305 family)